MPRTAVKPKYVTTLAQALERKFKGAEIGVEHVRGPRFRFVVIWKGFDRIDHADRQHKVWDLAAEVLDPKDVLKVTMILTMGHKDIGLKKGAA
jgi:hypothetical protein